MPEEPTPRESNEARAAAGLPPLPPAGKRPGRKAFLVTPQLLAKIEELAGRGLTRHQIAASIGWSPTTLYIKCGQIPALYEAVIRGEAAAVAAVENAIFVNATRPATDAGGNPVGMPGGSVDAQKFFLTRRGGDAWRAPEADSDNGGGKKVEVKIILPDNLRAVPARVVENLPAARAIDAEVPKIPRGE